MSTCTIAKSRASGTVMAPPSKSYAHRLLLAAFLSGKPVTVSNVNFSLDVAATLDCIKAMGASVSVEADKVTIEPGSGTLCGDFNCRESGSTLRFMIPVALALFGHGRFTGTEKLFSRGLGQYERIFSVQGIDYTLGSDSLEANGALRSGTFEIDPSQSSQYITGLLFALPLLEGDSRIVFTQKPQSKPYIDITMDVLRMAKVAAEYTSDGILIKGGQKFDLNDTAVEGDWSNAAFLEIYNYIGGDTLVLGLNKFSLQGDKVYRELFDRLDKGHCKIDISDCIDLGPVLFTLAAVKNGALFTGCSRLRIKESDRIADTIAELEKIGVKAVVKRDSVKISSVPAEHLAALESEDIVFDSHNDHRLAMSLTALASIFGARISGCEAVAKSFPRFFETVRKLKIEVTNE